MFVYTDFTEFILITKKMSESVTQLYIILILHSLEPLPSKIEFLTYLTKLVNLLLAM